MIPEGISRRSGMNFAAFQAELDTILQSAVQEVAKKTETVRQDRQEVTVKEETTRRQLGPQISRCCILGRFFYGTIPLFKIKIRTLPKINLENFASFTFWDRWL